MKAFFKSEDVFNITGRGLVITGHILIGAIHIGDSIKIGDKYFVIKGVESFSRNFGTSLPTDDHIGILITDQTKDEFIKTNGDMLGDNHEIKSFSERREDKINDLLDNG